VSSNEENAIVPTFFGVTQSYHHATEPQHRGIKNATIENKHKQKFKK